MHGVCKDLFARSDDEYPEARTHAKTQPYSGSVWSSERRTATPARLSSESRSGLSSLEDYITSNMLPATRLTPRLARPLLFRAINTPSTPSKTHESDSNVSSSTARTTGENRIPANDPQPRRDVPPTQGSAIAPEAHPTANNLPSSSGGNQDALLKQVSDQEIQRTMQAPNRAGVWSRSQQPRERAMTGPRFEQTMMEYQVGTMNSLRCGRIQPSASILGRK